MIEGVKIKNLTVHQDIPDVEQANVKPGFLMEVLRADEGIFKKFGQSTMTVAHKGTIKGFHYHEIQDDMWFVAAGKALVVLHDLRLGSPTYKQTQTLYSGTDDYKLVVIPTGVAHGCKVLSDEPVIMFYHTTEPYNAANPDEKRIPYDDPSIGFDWSTN
ncbi:MAG: spore coat protein [Candidatus Doudnabacteria bacterium RIFCSPHIGHO2_02_FULL_48_21]|uniref:Spore coat protein n=1 Tax=Candidatus Doudnabacteria bacterium RIFCSPLOWO2_02_FULL_48_13 TaxID=1817845 RepID=A0A1F5Q8A8_9BACT|nr:MAG: spore coat protein [Candidatus Doudnabacteria bacterium RIFCSPHIGHO2_01_48_18]OGE79875.1 MAG: spore coat protein [Candidatus Doudnabacteria bacterium RIFCSPHIGHO2_01_FULL_48_180]OGE91052.1 MAG: spore coat protein [Candidatus Doudnabacteria bacterium RIFCSPHIGHO2_12_FULL_47_25]OGE94038.1 MAG: spore coat protein [Candidatus Doudnabacteria bacterium RIFCSPHIGHO2_02_FULL_48_21]OGE98050.1 MAG: spore coat protein [Candidatus Doudnabacteria bacterium RIFCSPLOWO2_01_FULL_48_57]OGE98425.1 MAG: 